MLLLTTGMAAPCTGSSSHSIIYRDLSHMLLALRLVAMLISCWPNLTIDGPCCASPNRMVIRAPTAAGSSNTKWLYDLGSEALPNIAPRIHIEGTKTGWPLNDDYNDAQAEAIVPWRAAADHCLCRSARPRSSPKILDPAQPDVKPRNVIAFTFTRRPQLSSRSASPRSWRGGPRYAGAPQM